MESSGRSFTNRALLYPHLKSYPRLKPRLAVLRSRIPRSREADSVIGTLRIAALATPLASRNYPATGQTSEVLRNVRSSSKENFLTGYVDIYINRSLYRTYGQEILLITL